ncbi:MAG TPA: serine/threonine-protein kinase [Planctomycetota bacterium]|nr:serine/threonine-protein kinase [Planctomycetota bacterium]
MQCPDCRVVLPAEARFCLSCGAKIEPVAPDAPVDKLLESLRQAIGFQYRIDRLLGRGGMGAVYLAHEFALDREVAIKVLPPELAGTSELRERFRREARTAARMSHPNIVPLYTFGEVSGLVYFVMGFVRGESLASRLARQGPFGPEEARTLLASLCDALEFAHRRGVVHRDIKPDNILMDAESNEPVLTDFGIAKVSVMDAQLTTAGQLIGTPHYMSPEQASGSADIGARSDLYSLGVVAYELLSGRRPFDSDNPIEALTQRLTSDPKPLGSVTRGVPSDLALTIDRCLERDPAKRWPDAKSLREALLPSDDDPEETVPGRMLRVSVTVGSLMGLAILYLAMYRVLHPEIEVSANRIVKIAVGTVPIVLLGLIGAIRLRAEGMSARSILARAFQQPRWWRSWWPPTFRRRGDQWGRLPPEIKRFRVLLGMLQVYVFAIFLPLQLQTIGSDRLPVLQLTAIAVMFALLLLTFRQRRIAKQFILAHTNATAMEASSIVSTPTWRATAWRRGPASLILGGQVSKTPAAIADARDSERSTPHP